MHPLFRLTLACWSASLVAGPVVPLYTPQPLAPATESLSDQGWLRVSSNFDDEDYSHTAENGVTAFDSFPVEFASAWTTVGLITGSALHPAL